MNPRGYLPYWFHPVQTGTDVKSDYNTVLILCQFIISNTVKYYLLRLSDLPYGNAMSGQLFYPKVKKGVKIYDS